MLRQANPLWDFALRLYGSEGVERACLALQDRHGADVNLLLFCCWAALAEGRPLSPERLQGAMDAVTDWQREVVVPLRAVRRRLRQPPPAFADGDSAALRQTVKTAELDAERQELGELLRHATLAGHGASEAALRHCLRANLETYLALAGAPCGGDGAPDLDPLIAAALRMRKKSPA